MEPIPLGTRDAQLLLGDSPTTPMHIGGFSVFGLPPNAPTDFVARFVARLRKQPINKPPWNYRLAKQSLLASKLTPAWEIVTDEDVTAHVLRHALPAPGGQCELAELISRLHSQPLDMARPLWEFHAIEGYAHRRFVIYMKLHHAVFDATTAMRATNLLTSETPNVRAHVPWSAPPHAHTEKAGKPGREPGSTRHLDASLLSTFQDRIRRRLDIYRSLPEIAQAMARTLNAAIGDDSGLVAPYMGPTCIVNGPLTWRRCVATHAFKLARVKAVAKASESTLNDVVLAICAGALRRYLAEMKALPQRALTAGVPVGLKHGEGEQAGNRVSGLFATLATDVRDPFKRLMAIKRSMQAGKQHMLAMSAPTVDLYSTAMIVPAMLGMMTGSVMANVVIANVPGPRTRLVVAGAPMEEFYPLSVLPPNMALNITCVSYDKGLYLGLITCPDLLPHVHNLAAYMGDAFNELAAGVRRHAASKSSLTRQPRPMKRPRLKRPAARS